MIGSRMRRWSGVLNVPAIYPCGRNSVGFLEGMPGGNTRPQDYVVDKGRGWLYKMDIKKTNQYTRWESSIRDIRARARVEMRIRRLSLGNPGDAQPVGEGVSEMRIHYGPGYRVYYKQIGLEIVILLVGGTKKTQSEDVAFAKELARSI